MRAERDMRWSKILTSTSRRMCLAIQILIYIDRTVISSNASDEIELAFAARVCASTLPMNHSDFTALQVLIPSYCASSKITFTKWKFMTCSSDQGATWFFRISHYLTALLQLSPHINYRALWSFLYQIEVIRAASVERKKTTQKKGTTDIKKY